MIITILKRYDVNGAFTHDFDAKISNEIFKTDINSMWRISESFDIKEMKETIEFLELKCEDLTEQNRLLTIRINELNKNNEKM